MHEYLLPGLSLGLVLLFFLWRKTDSLIEVEPSSNEADNFAELRIQSVPPSQEFGVPERIWVIDNHIMIRDEYHYGLLAILKWMTSNPGHKLKSRPIVFERGAPIAEMKEYENPFVGYENATVVFMPILVIGPPGTGKSNFLRYTLDQRRRLRLPTVFIANHLYVRVYLKGRVLRFPYSMLDELSAKLPENTWYLIDSNEDIQELPQALMDNRRGGFAMQASSSWVKRPRWVNKMLMRYFTMSAWEVPELIAGRELQPPSQQPSDAQIKEYVEKLGGSARDVYFYAKDLNRRINTIRWYAKQYLLEHPNLVPQLLELTSSSSFILLPEMSPDILHVLVSLYPRSDSNRAEFLLKCSYTWDLIMEKNASDTVTDG